MEDSQAEAQVPQIFIALSNFPPPKPLVFDDNLATTREFWKKAWTRYEIATGIQKQKSTVRVLTSLSVIGEDGVKAKLRIKTELRTIARNCPNLRNLARTPSLRYSR